MVAYRARLPLRSAGTGVADDRGVFRIHGLDPGKYWIRSTAHTMDDGSGWLPTFGPQARAVREARTHTVTVDSDTTDTDVNPEPGSLFRLSGLIVCDAAGPVTLTLSSETGRQSTRSGCPKGTYQFDGLAPAVYEVYVTLEDGTAAGFIELFLDQDNTAGTVQVMQLPSVEFEIRRPGSNAVADVPVTLIGRRQDVAETESSRDIPRGRTTLAPGHWEFRAQVPPGQFVESIVNMRVPPRRPWKAERASDWFDVFIEQRATSRVRITVSDQAGQISGRVLDEGSKPVAAAPVFLWPVTEAVRRSLSGPSQVLTDTAGRFHFKSLPPGDYRPLASFDVNEIDEDLIELSHAVVIHAAASQTAVIDLTVWSSP